jgi:hypothetical protein
MRGLSGLWGYRSCVELGRPLCLWREHVEGSAIQLVSQPLEDSESCIRSIIENFGSSVSERATLLFFPPKADRAAIERVLSEVPFRDRFVGCTTAGEISTSGYADGVVSGISFPDSKFSNLTFEISDLQNPTTEALATFARDAHAVIAQEQQKSPKLKAFGMLLIDGLSVAEEMIAGHLSALFPNLPIVGASAGDGLKFEQTFLISKGKFRSGTALFMIFLTEHPFQCLKTQHFSPSEEKMVITSADPSKRVVYEINGEKAALEYARLLNLPLEDLCPSVFAKHPVCSRHGGDYYMRSIQRVNSYGSLLFYCPIDEGLVLTLSRRLNIVSQTRQALALNEERLGKIQVMLASECILRRLEVIQNGLVDEMNRLYVPLNTVGFHTYGEQFGSVHINQTLTAVCFGSES